jgi:hypothetical protein
MVVSLSRLLNECDKCGAQSLCHSLCEKRDRALNGSNLRFDVLVPHCDVSEQRNPPHKSVSGVIGSRKRVLLRWLLLLLLLLLFLLVMLVRLLVPLLLVVLLWLVLLPLPLLWWSLRLLITLQRRAVETSLMDMMSLMSAVSI